MLTDIRMPLMDGIALALATARDHPQIIILLMTAYADQRERASNLGQPVTRLVALKHSDVTHDDDRVMLALGREPVQLPPPLATLVLRLDKQATGTPWLFPGAKPGPQFYPVSAIDYVTGYLMAFGAMVALHRRATQGGSWMVRISLAQTGKWLLERGEIDEAQLKDIPKDFSADEIERWSQDSDTAVGRLRHLAPIVKLCEIWNRES